jgi:hypothetical protein
MPPERKTSKYQSLLQNQSDRDGAGVEFRHGREERFDERSPAMSTEAAFRAALDQAHAALGDGKAQDGERLAKAVSALVRAERDVAVFVMTLRAANESDDEDALRAELHRRLSLFVDASRAGHPQDALARIAATGVGP